MLSGCSPHPGSGVWESTQSNDFGLSRLVVGFDGRASFDTKSSKTISWHCFWSASGKQEIQLSCTPSTNPDNGQKFSLNVNEQGLAEFKQQGKRIALLKRLDEDPSKQE